MVVSATFSFHFHSSICSSLQGSNPNARIALCIARLDGCTGAQAHCLFLIKINGSQCHFKCLHRRQNHGQGEAGPFRRRQSAKPPQPTANQAWTALASRCRSGNDNQPAFCQIAAPGPCLLFVVCPVLLFPQDKIVHTSFECLPNGRLGAMRISMICGAPSPIVSSRQNHSHIVQMLAERSSRSDENQCDCLGWSNLDKINIVSKR
jgi:hypothetical protein